MPISSEVVDIFRVNVGRYFDGVSAQARSVTIRLEADGLRLRQPGIADTYWSIAATYPVASPRSGEWFTLGHRGMNAARLQLPPRMFDRLIEMYGRPPSTSILNAARPYALPLLLFAAWMMILVGVITPWLAREVSAFIAPAILVQQAQQRVEARVARLDRDRRAGAQFCVNPEGLKALTVLSDVIAGLPSQSFPPYFAVIRNRQVNAHSYGAGFAILNSGLIDFVRDEAELLSVMAHEMGHGEARHSSRSDIEKSIFSNFADILLRSQLNSYAYILTGQAILDTFRSQEMEREADRFATLQLQQAEVDPAGGAAFMRRLAELDGEVGFLSTHPTYAERASLFASGARPGLPLLNAAQWKALKSICNTITKTAPPFPTGPSG